MGTSGGVAEYTIRRLGVAVFVTTQHGGFVCKNRTQSRQVIQRPQGCAAGASLDFVQKPTGWMQSVLVSEGVFVIFQRHTFQSVSLTR
jgi:hypothetical protein